MLSRWKQKLKLNNSGAALITVIIVIAFISVMVTVVLYLSGVNYHMKTADKEIKDSFYDAETAMESIRAQMMVEAKKAFQEAYKESMCTIASEADVAVRNTNFNTKFVNTLNDNIKANIAAMGTGATLEDYLKSLVPVEYRAGLTVVATPADAPLTLDLSGGKAELKGVTIVYSKEDYMTQITTDFVIKAPDGDFALDTSTNTWDPSDDPATAFERKIYEMDECVNYANWIKE